MKSGIFRNIFLLSGAVLVLAVLAVELYITGAVRSDHIEALSGNLAVQAKLISRDVPFASATPLDERCRRLKETTGVRVTVIRADGTVIGDSDTESGSMENHAGRPELQQADLSGTGVAVRRSETLHTDFLYVAVHVRGAENQQGFVRMSMPLTAVDAAVNALRIKIIVVVSLVLVAAAAFSLWQIDRIRRLTTQIRDFSASLAAGDFGKRLFLSEAGEFEEIADDLNAMALSLQGQVKSANDEKAKLETALLGISDGVLLLNQAGRIVIANRAFREMFGIEGDIENRPFLEVVRNHALAEIVRDAHEHRKTSSGEVEIPFPEQISLLVNALPIIQESLREDRFRGTLVALHDITRVKALERVRKDFVANVSHELKTPIAAITGFAETLLDGALDNRDDAGKFIGIIHNHSARLHRLVEDLLTLSRIELGELEFRLQPVDVRQAVESTLALIRPKAASGKINVSVDVEPDLPPAWADPDRITQVFLNLLDNAVKFTPERGSVRVSARIVRSSEFMAHGKTGTGISEELSAKNGELDRNFIEISVEDTGPGIPPTFIPRLGERFYRVDPARSRELGGTGLGLAIVKHILQAHGASLTIRNAARRGAIVSFCLPAAESQPPSSTA